MIIDSLKEVLSYFIEQIYHFQEVFFVFLLFDFFLAHHFDVKSDSSVNFSGFWLFSDMHLAVNQDLTVRRKFFFDLLDWVKNIRLKINEELEVFFVVILIWKLLEKFKEVLLTESKQVRGDKVNPFLLLVVDEVILIILPIKKTASDVLFKQVVKFSLILECERGWDKFMVSIEANGKLHKVFMRFKVYFLLIQTFFEEGEKRAEVVAPIFFKFFARIDNDWKDSFGQKVNFLVRGQLINKLPPNCLLVNIFKDKCGSSINMILNVFLLTF